MISINPKYLDFEGRIVFLYFCSLCLCFSTFHAWCSQITNLLSSTPSPPKKKDSIGAVKSVYMILPYNKRLHTTESWITAQYNKTHYTANVSLPCKKLFKSKNWESLYFVIWKVDCINLVSTMISILLWVKKHCTVPRAQHGNSTANYKQYTITPSSFLTNLGFSTIQCSAISYVWFSYM